MQTEELQKTAALLLEKITTRSQTANEIVSRFVQSHKYLTFEDRKALSDFVFSTLRARARLEWAYPDADWLTKIRLLAQNGLPDVSEAPFHVQFEVPEWFAAHVPDAAHEVPMLLDPAPVVLRVVGDRAEVQDLLAQDGVISDFCARSPLGLVLTKRAAVTETKAYKKGLVEIQDEGAQLLSIEIGVKPKDDVFDFCAGAGGKSLIFAQLMQNRGFIQAYDAAPKRLSELTKRAHRAGVSIIKTVSHLPPAHKKFDHVVVDAPCSGTGTWRRNPDGRWKLSEKQLKGIVARQAEILETAQEYVKNGHFLSYITCSLTRDENEDQAERFLAKNPRFRLLRQKRYSPFLTQTDGFYLAVFQKI